MKKPVLHHLQDYFFPHPRNNHRPHIFSTASIAVLVFAIVFLESAYLVQTKFVFLNTNFLASVLPGVLMELTNQDRTAQGVGDVAESPVLDAAAQAAANDMAAKGYFAHVSPDGKSPWYWLDQAGYKYTYAGQNLAVNFTDSANVESAWMESPTHRANIVKPEYTQVGFGTANGMYKGQDMTFVVEFFAAPAPIEVASAAPAPAPAKPRQVVQSASPTTTARVLASETRNTAPTVTAAPAASPSWFARLLASPLYTLVGILTALLTIVAISFSTAMFMRGKLQHPRVVFGGAFLFLLLAGAFATSVLFAGSPLIFPTDGQGASAITALEH